MGTDMERMQTEIKVLGSDIELNFKWNCVHSLQMWQFPVSMPLVYWVHWFHLDYVGKIIVDW